MRIPTHRTRKWERAADRGPMALERLVWKEVARLRRKRAAWRSRQINRSIPKARRQALKADAR